MGIKGIGLYETSKDGFFVHVDTRTSKSFWYGQAQASRTTFQDANSALAPVAPTVQVDTSAADPKKMWDFFKSKGMTQAGIAGVMGNLYAESSLRPCNLQSSFEKKLGMTDAEYTAAVDAGTYTNFVRDGAGYGLAQWTYWSLKQDMLDFHKAKGKSIGDLNTQMEFLVHQLSTEFAAVWKILTTTASVREASNAMLLKFERPADQSESVQQKRADYSQKYYDQFAAKKPVFEPEKAT
jgi:flagellar capping protein FliD